jgi:hypothetical protein
MQVSGWGCACTSAMVQRAKSIGLATGRRSPAGSGSPNRCRYSIENQPKCVNSQPSATSVTVIPEVGLALERDSWVRRRRTSHRSVVVGTHL